MLHNPCLPEMLLLGYPVIHQQFSEHLFQVSSCTLGAEGVVVKMDVVAHFCSTSYLAEAEGLLAPQNSRLACTVP